ncbi:MAG TPA: ABC transporter ATP-binding protein [Clostridium sp.]|nr:ABC transporter ATP-binding protein [Clostridium sp.]
MIELAVSNLKKYMDSTQIFEDVSFKIYDGEKVGIVGDNGTGKSTLLKLIAGIITLTRDDKGSLFIPKDAKISYLDQIPHYSDELNVMDVLNLAFEETYKIDKEIKGLEEDMALLSGEDLEKALKRYSRLQEHYDSLGGYDIEEKLSKVCTGLKINKSLCKMNFNLLSGGEKTRVMLGRILLENPDILLLDEPTNHLDMESCEWLEGYLRNYKGMVIIVSHDRYFLDNVVTKIIEIEDMRSETYNGNYSSYIKQKEDNMMIQFNQYKEQQKQIAAMEKAIKDLREWAKRADNPKFFKRAASMQKALNKIQRIEKPKFDKTNVKLNFNETERSGNEVIKVKDLCKRYDDKILFENAHMLVNFKERVGLIGANGCGKTTFLKMLLGKDSVDSGSIILGDSVKYAYLPQNIIFDNEDATILEEFRSNINILEGKAREYLSKFMFFGADVFKKLKHLSGGERIRVKLSQLLYNDINLLILDEPTNHLDISSIDTLEEALGKFKGTVFFISHDRYFLNKMSTTVVEVENHKFTTYKGNYDYYKYEKSKRVLSEDIVKSSSSNNIINKAKEHELDKGPVQDSAQDWKAQKEQQREKRKQENRRIKLEENILCLEEKIKVIDEKLIECGSNYDEASKLYKEKGDLEKQLECFMEEWDNIC